MHLKMSALAATICAAGFLAAGAAAKPAHSPATTPVAEQGVIELVICLDTSGSMSGLIDAAKQKLWAIVNDLALAEPTPRLRVGLLTFGNDGHAPENGWVAVQTQLTDDLDLVSQKLFELQTNGGTELVGRVLQHAGRLDWTPSEDALKLIVVAGNESADQDTESPFRDQCRQLISRGVMINAIYCGPETDDLAPAWREVAALADGHFASIDQDNGTVVIETPFDEQLGALSGALNRTYIPVGHAGQSGAGNQMRQDDNANELNRAAAATRAQTKAQQLYHCSWDLIDAHEAGTVKIAEVPADDLPEEMREMTVEQRAAHVAEMSRQRSEIQAEILAVGRERDAFVREVMLQQSVDESRSLDFAVRRAVRDQAASKGFRFHDDDDDAAPRDETPAADAG